jgi:23S rRNA (guanosine2251-2'-O)-methyltransferase
MEPSDRLPFAATTIATPYDDLRPPVRVLLDNVRSLYNVGAFFRTCDAVRVDRLYLSGITARPPRKEIAKTALGAESRVAWEGIDDPLALIDRLHTNEHAHEHPYEIAAIETSAHAVDLFDWQPRFPVCLLFGHEVDGLQPALIARCDTHVRIPMLGLKHSLNVATAGGVVLYELLRKYRALSRSSQRSPITPAF